MASDPIKRKLAAILAADVAGYSRLMGVDEEDTLRRLKALRHELIDPKMAEYRGRVVKTTGDGILAEFPSVIDAVRCASDIQHGMAERNIVVPDEKRIEFRVGINVGDIIIDADDIHGDGVNIAARLESIAEPGGICLSESSYQEVRGKLALKFEDMGEQHLKNIARPIHAYRVLVGKASEKKAMFSAATPLPEKPSIAVLPFQNMSGDPEQEYFADGMVEEIITALSNIKTLFVIARNSSFTYKNKAVNIKQVGRELGVHYVLEGSVRKAGNRLRITGQLIDANNGAHLWADHFEGSLEDVFELQDKVASSVVGVMEPTLQAAELRRSVQRPTRDLTAYDLYLRARSDAESWEKERVLRGLELVRQALIRDPSYGSALAVKTICCVSIHVNGWTDDLDAARRDGVDAARRAVQVSNDDPYALAHAAHAFAYFGEDIDGALALIDRALQLNPSLARGWLRSGWLRLWAGQPDMAISHFETYMRLSPRESRAVANLGIGIAHFFTHRLEHAASLLRQALQEGPTWAPTHRFLASCYAHMGRLRDAQDVIRRLRDLTPVVIPSAEHWRRPEDREFYLDGLRLAVG